MKCRKRIAAAVVAAVMLLGGCSSETRPVGNLEEVTLGENDVFAVINVADYGSMTVKLFPEVAPKAVERFITFATRGYYDGKNFHRVIEDFMIQGGSFTGTGYDGEVAEKEYFEVETSKFAYHFYGALCFAKNSNGNYCQFYIVNNDVPVDIAAIAAKLREQLANAEVSSRMLEEDKKYYSDYAAQLEAIPDAVKEKYALVGGDYQLDGTSTVFGQIIDGLDVLEAISSVETVTGNLTDDAEGTASKPINDIIIESIEVIRVASMDEDGAQTSKVARKTTAAETPAPQTQESTAA